MKICLLYLTTGMILSVYGFDQIQGISARDLQLEIETSEPLNSRSSYEDDASSLLIARSDHELISTWKRDQTYTRPRPTLQNRHFDFLSSEDQTTPLRKRGLRSKLINCVGSLCGKQNISPDQSVRGPSLDRPTLPVGHPVPPENPRRSSTQSDPSTPSVNPALLGGPVIPPTPPGHAAGRGSSSTIHHQGIAAARRFSLDRVWSRQSSTRPSTPGSTLEPVPGPRISLGTSARRRSGSFDSSWHSSRHSSRASSPRHPSTHLPFPEPVAGHSPSSSTSTPQDGAAEASPGQLNGGASSSSPSRASTQPEARFSEYPPSRIPAPPIRRVQLTGDMGITNMPLVRAQVPSDVRTEIHLPGSHHPRNGRGERPIMDIGD